MAIKRMRAIGQRDDYEQIVTAARLVYIDGLKQVEVASHLGISQGAVSKLLDKAIKEQIVRIHIVLPRLLALEQALESKLTPKGVRRVHIVPGGSGNNPDNLGIKGAEILAESLSQTDELAVSIVLTCGETMLAVVDHFLELLVMDANLHVCLRQKKVTLYPSALYSDSRLDANYPYALVSILALMMKRHHNFSKIEAHIPILPPDFYATWTAKDQRDYINRYDIQNVIECAKRATIFLVGIGSPAREAYMDVQKHIGVEVDSSEFVSESNYIPIRRDGSQHEDIAKKLVALTIDDFRQLMWQPDRMVIAIAGGEDKREAIATAVAHPYFNTLVTDEGTATYLLEAFV